MLEQDILKAIEEETSVCGEYFQESISDMKLRRIDFENCIFQECKFENCDFTNSSFSHIEMTKCSLSLIHILLCILELMVQESYTLSS